MPSGAIFVFDPSYPSAEVALPLEPVRHVIVSTRLIEPPPGHRTLRLREVDGPGALAGNLRILRAARRDCRPTRCVVIGTKKTRREQTLLNILYAAALGVPVQLFDGEHMSPLVWRDQFYGLARFAAHVVMDPCRSAVRHWRLRWKAGKIGRAGRLAGVYGRRKRFSLPLDKATAATPRRSLYGRWGDGWYLSDLSHHPLTYRMQTSRHRLSDVILHVEAVAGGSVSSLFKDGRLLDYPYFISKRNKNNVHTISGCEKLFFLKNGVDLLFFFSGYWHWLIEAVPRILDLLDDGVDFSVWPLIVPRLEPFQRQFFQLFGIDAAHHVVELNPGDCCRLAECLVPTAYFPFGTDELDDYSGQPSGALLGRIRDAVLARLPPADPQALPAPRRLYISRERAGRRKLVNEGQITDALRKLGFVKVILEDLPWLEQVRLFAQAEFIVGMHGAGLGNMVFSSSASLVEFFNPLEVRAYFAVMARELDMDYAYVICRPGSEDTGFDDLRIDVGAVVDLIRRMDADRGLGPSNSPLPPRAASTIIDEFPK